MYNYNKKEDEQIQKNVMSELRWDQSVTPDELSATVNEGKVTLRGSVPHFYEKSKAEDARLAAWKALGVPSVENNLKIAP